MPEINQKVIQDITCKLANRFEKDLFIASVKNITNSSSPIRFNNFAYATRELIRSILERLAPDNEVYASNWYKNETKIEKGISRRQRIYYAIHGGLSPNFIQDALEIDIESFQKNFQDIFKNLNKFTHITKATFGINNEKVIDLVNQTLRNILAFFELITETKECLEEALINKIDTVLIETMLESTFDEIDILATHHYLEEVHAEVYNLLDIDHQFMFFETKGEITYTLQWGSNYDVKVGDGLLVCKIRVKSHSNSGANRTVIPE